MLAALAALVSLAVLAAHGMLHCSVRRFITVIAVTATLAMGYRGCGACGDCGVCCACGACVPQSTRDASVPASLAILKMRCVRCDCRVVVHAAPAVLAMVVVRK